MDINPLAIIGIVFGLVFVGALVLYLGWRGAVLGIATFAVWLLALKRLDLSGPAPIFLLLILMGIAYFAEIRWQLKDFHRLADVLGASWRRGGDSALGAIEGMFNGRKFKMDFVRKGQGRYAENWIVVTISCASAGWDFSLPGNSIRVFGSKWLARRRHGNAQANDATKRRLYGELVFLRSRDARLFHQGTLATGGYGLEWTCNGHIHFSSLRATLRCLDEIAGELEKSPTGRFQGLSSAT